MTITITQQDKYIYLGMIVFIVTLGSTWLFFNEVIVEAEVSDWQQKSGINDNLFETVYEELDCNQKEKLFYDNTWELERTHNDAFVLNDIKECQGYKQGYVSSSPDSMIIEWQDGTRSELSPIP